jgi:hypothetical protein
MASTDYNYFSYISMIWIVFLLVHTNASKKIDAPGKAYRGHPFIDMEYVHPAGQL